MQFYLWVMLGSALGGAGRYWCAGLVARHCGETFPWGTLTVNVLGSFAIGFVDALATPGSPSRQFVMAGLYGGFTTFSAFSLQTLHLVRGGQRLRAGANVGASVATCLFAVWLGSLAGMVFNRAALILPGWAR